MELVISLGSNIPENTLHPSYKDHLVHTFATYVILEEVFFQYKNLYYEITFLDACCNRISRYEGLEFIWSIYYFSEGPV
jgi:hypothetical protein